MDSFVYSGNEVQNENCTDEMKLRIVVGMV